jgi:O-antigen/teichoic acid export membrane protein
MGVVKNFTYNTILTLSSYIVGLLVFPYISRILGVDNIGIVGFVDTTINYFVLFATLGINTVGIRSIAACGNDREKRSQVFSALIVWGFVFTVTVCIIYIIAISTIPRLCEHKELYYIGLPKLLFTPFLIEWFYIGIENFKYITIRSIIIKILYAVSVIVFVKDVDDLAVYFLLTSLVIVISSLINIRYSKHFISLRLTNLKLKQYIKQILSLGMFQILISMYTIFNVMFLGFVSNDTEVGYYYTALKLFVIIIGFLIAFTSVMLPRMSSLLAENNKVSFNSMTIKSLNALFTFCFPLLIGGTVLAPQIIWIMSGQGYAGAIVPMQIMMPLLLIVGFSQINVIQVLIPMRKEKTLLIITTIVACVGVTLAFLLVPKYGAMGAAVVYFLSECTQAVVGLIYSTRKKLFVFPIKTFIINFMYSIPYVLICWGTTKMNSSPINTLIMAIIICFLYFVFVQFKCIKNEMLINIVKTTLKRQ